MALQLLLVDLDAADVDRALEPRALAAAEPRLVVAKPLRKVETPLWMTAKPIDEWTGSTA